MHRTGKFKQIGDRKQIATKWLNNFSSLFRQSVCRYRCYGNLKIQSLTSGTRVGTFIYILKAKKRKTLHNAAFGKIARCIRRGRVYRCCRLIIRWENGEWTHEWLHDQGAWEKGRTHRFRTDEREEEQFYGNYSGEMYAQNPSKASLRSWQSVARLTQPHDRIKSNPQNSFMMKFFLINFWVWLVPLRFSFQELRKSTIFLTNTALEVRWA